MKLSVCIITKNEEKNIENCLKKLQGYGFEIVVVDTGSTDATRSIAEKYADKVCDYVWCNDFAKAKNFSVSQASNEMVMVLDSDEFLEQIDLEHVMQQVTEHPGQVGRIHRKNLVLQNGMQMENVEWINRIFSKELYEYQGKIHEQLVAKDGSTYQMYQAAVEITHAGYFLSEEERKKKAMRNMVLLEAELSEKGEDPYILYQLGKSCSFMGDYGKACDYYGKALSFDLEPTLEYVIDAVECYGYALLNAGRVEQALFFQNIEPEFGNSSDFQFLMGLIYMNNEQFEDAVAAYQKAISLKKARMLGTDSFLSSYNIGVVYECLGDVDKAMKYYQECGQYLPSIKRIGEYYEKRNTKQSYLFYQQMCFEGTRLSKEEHSWFVQKKIESKKRLEEEMPKTAIVILSYNTCQETMECIESIREHCNPETYELIIVDNASTDESVEWLKRQADIKLQCNKDNAGFPRGCNQGIVLAQKTSDIWLLNSDTLVPPNALFWLQMGLYESKHVGAVGSVSNNVSNYQNTKEPDLTAENYMKYAQKQSFSITNPYEKKSWLVGFSLLLKRKVLEEVGMLDEQFSPGNFEDNDLGYRILKAGYQNLLCKNSFVFHYGSRSFGKQKENFSNLLLTNMQKFEKKWKMHPWTYSYVKTWEVAQIQEDPESIFSILEVGCGVGASLTRLRYQYPKAELCGVEKKEEAAAIANCLESVLNEDIMGLEKKEWTQKFNYILTGGIWEHVKEPDHLLKKICDWLGKNGEITGSFYNRNHIASIRSRQGNEEPLSVEEQTELLDAAHAHLYSADEMLELLEVNHIVVDEITFKRRKRELTVEEKVFLEKMKWEQPSKNPMEYEAYQYFWKGHLM